MSASASVGFICTPGEACGIGLTAERTPMQRVGDEHHAHDRPHVDAGALPESLRSPERRCGKGRSALNEQDHRA